MPHLSFTVGVELDLVLVAGQHLAEAAHADERAGVVADLLLVRGAEAGRVARVAGKHRACPPLPSKP